MTDKELDRKLTNDKVLDGLLLDMADAIDKVTDRLGAELCPVCGSTLSDSGACADLGDNNCLYMGPGDDNDD